VAKARPIHQEESAVPEEWPDSVPLPPGTLVSGEKYGFLINVTFATDNLDAAFAPVQTITGAGFTLVSEAADDSTGFWTFTDGEYTLTYAINADPEIEGMSTLVMSVQEAVS
jgi:hypothetical protein